jgi:hypothetical protein
MCLFARAILHAQPFCVVAMSNVAKWIENTAHRIFA